MTTRRLATEKTRKTRIVDKTTGRAVDKTKGRAVWTISDETTLIRFLLERKAEAGDDFSFKTSTWNAAAARMAQHREKGGVKGPRGCKQKWAQLCNTFRIVDAIMARFVFSWDGEHGANIDTRLEDIWAAYIEKHPEASPFRNKGWLHYDDITNIIPTTNARRRQLTRKNANNSSSYNDDGPRKRHHSEISHEESLDSEVYEVIAEVARTVIRAVQFLFDDGFFDVDCTDIEPPNSEELTRSRWQIALRRIQELERGLDDDQILDLMELLQNDASLVDAYLDIEDEGVRKAWVQRNLAQRA